MSEAKKPLHGTFTYYRHFLTNKETYRSGERGWAMLNINDPLTIIDITIDCSPKTFVIGAIMCGDTNMLLAAGEQRAEHFSPRLEVRYFRPQEMQRGQVVIVAFRNVYSDKDESIDIQAKVEQPRKS